MAPVRGNAMIEWIWRGETAHLFVRNAVTHVLQIAADVVHVGVTKEDPSEVFLADGGQAFRVGEELYLKHLCLQVVHEPGGTRQTAAADRKRQHQKLPNAKKHLPQTHKNITGSAVRRPTGYEN